jgi:hypothetical protein
VLCHFLLLNTADDLALVAMASPSTLAANAKALFIWVCALLVKVRTSLASCAINEEVETHTFPKCYLYIIDQTRKSTYKGTVQGMESHAT